MGPSGRITHMIGYIALLDCLGQVNAGFVTG